MASFANAVLLLVAIGFIAITYVTGKGNLDRIAGLSTGPAPANRTRLIYRAARWLAPFSLLGLSVHLTLFTVLRLGPGVTPYFLALAAVLWVVALLMVWQLWRQR